MTPTFFLFCALAALVLALILIWAGRFNAACNRNTVGVGIECDVDDAREGIRQLTADVQRLHGEVKATRRSLSELKADRSIIGLPVKSASEPKRGQQQPPRRSPPAPTPKKAQGKR